VDDRSRRRRARRVAGAALAALLVGLPLRASAQIYETVGTRAQGMGGAFVAVADDATATWWNPAALILSNFSLVFDRGQVTEPAESVAGRPVWRAKTSGFAVSYPALGLSYYRLRISEIASDVPTAAAEPGRQDDGAVGIGLRSRVATQFGATVGQSLGDHVVVASTVKLVRTGEAIAGLGSLDDADELDVPVDSSADLDLGVLVLVGSARVGLSVKHVTEPTVGDDATGIRLARQARAGFAWVAGQTGAPVRVTAAFDADLTKTPTAVGEARHVAGGVEVALRQHVALRGGVSMNTIGDTSNAGSTGISIGLMRGVYLDAARTFGSDRSRKGWAVGFRLTI
jgi:hypothetical protein